MKHKHADLIHAWADGAEIQYYHDGTNEWYSSTDNQPGWDLDVAYRIKPEEKKPVVRWLWAYKVGDEMYISSQFYQIAVTDDWVKLEWSRTEFQE